MFVTNNCQLLPCVCCGKVLHYWHLDWYYFYSRIHARIMAIPTSTRTNSSTQAGWRPHPKISTWGYALQPQLPSSHHQKTTRTLTLSGRHSLGCSSDVWSWSRADMTSIRWIVKTSLCCTGHPSTTGARLSSKKWMNEWMFVSFTELRLKSWWNRSFHHT